MIGYQTQMPTHLGQGPGLDTMGRIQTMSFTLNAVSKAASYTVLQEDSGSVFIATAAATFTLPAVASSAGCTWTFINGADTDMVVTAPAGTLVADGNAAATSATFSTASHKIGGSCIITGNGTKYYLQQTGVLLAVPTIS
jgi:hypothetical protein